MSTRPVIESLPGPVPSLIRSRKHLEQNGIHFRATGAQAPTQLPITSGGTTYSMAQEIAWIDFDHFAVGRWDGSMSIFAYNSSPSQGPVITTAVTSPSAEGVQMITWVGQSTFASSNDDASIVIWQSASGTWTDLKAIQQLDFDSSFGVANSGTSYATSTTVYFIAGHANGYLTIWSAPVGSVTFSLVTSVNVCSAHPVNPWGLHNVRGVETIFWSDLAGYIVSGSEDGDLCVVQVPSGTILSRTVYNPNAQRGINSIATFGQNLLVANCSVGANDSNLWYYWIDSSDWSITLRDSTNLKVNPSAPQVFNFDVIWSLYDNGVCFFCSTEEGALWMGIPSNNGQQFSILGYEAVTMPLGSALAFNAQGCLCLVGYNLYEFTTLTQSQSPRNGNPETLPTNLIAGHS